MKKKFDIHPAYLFLIGVILLGAIISAVYFEKQANPTYHFGKGFDITKKELDSLYEQTGNPIKLCSIEQNKCLLINKITDG